MTDLKGRVWAFVLYPESCIEYKDMISYLEKLNIPMAISPLHIPSKNRDNDVNEEKKEHYHILMYFDGVKQQKDLKKLIDFSTSSYDRKYFNWDMLVDKNNVLGKKGKYPYFMKVNCISSQFRYLIHLDQVRKQQFAGYKISHFITDDEQKYNTIVLLNGFNEKNYLTQNSVSPDEQLLNIVQENNFQRIDELIKYLVYSKNHFLLNFIKKNYSYCYNMLLAGLICKNQVKKMS